MHEYGKIEKTCLILEDDFASALEIQVILNKMGFNKIDVVDSIRKADALLNSYQYTIILSDVNVDGCTSIDYFNKFYNDDNLIYLDGSNNEEHFQHAQRKRNHIFLIKPFNEITLRSIINVTLAQHKNEHKLRNPYIIINYNGLVRKIKSNEIVFIKSVKNDCEIYTLDKLYVIRKSLASYENELVDSTFVRCQRSYIVNLDHVDSINKNRLKINIANTIVPIGSNYKKQFFDSYFNNRL